MHALLVVAGYLVVSFGVALIVGAFIRAGSGK